MNGLSVLEGLGRQYEEFSFFLLAWPVSDSSGGKSTRKWGRVTEDGEEGRASGRGENEGKDTCTTLRPCPERSLGFSTT